MNALRRHLRRTALYLLIAYSIGVDAAAQVPIPAPPQSGPVALIGGRSTL